jgi:hydroxymethylglutaryl-CoA lyase
MQPDNVRRVYIQEVAPRDGLQIEPNFVPTEEKIKLINRLGRTGLAKIEATSFTSPKAIPNLRDAEAVMQQIERVPGVVYAALVPNVRGCERALAARVGEINVVMSASESHNQANVRMTREQSLAQFAELVKVAHGSKAFLNASLATTFGCPFDGWTPAEEVMRLVERILEIGFQGISLCDTTGMANPRQVARLCERVRTRWPEVPFTLHLHNTRGMGLSNAAAGLDAGIDRFDSSLGGLGGCPFAPGATGNVCTEDLTHMFAQMGCQTGVDLDLLIEIAKDLPRIVGHEVPGQVMKAGPADQKYPKPDWVGTAKNQIAMTSS